MSSPNELSFLPDDYLARKLQHRTNVICAMLFLVVMVAIGLAFYITERSNREVEARHASKLREYTEEAKRIQQAEKMKEKQRRMAQQAELAASLLEKVPRSFILAELTNSMPPGMSLLDFQLESRKKVAPAPAAATPAPRKGKKGAAQPEPSQPRQYDVNLKVTGVADTDVQVAQFISRLNGSRLLRDVNLVISDQFAREGQELRRFTIEMTLDPAADVLRQEQSKSRTAAVELK